MSSPEELIRNGNLSVFTCLSNFIELLLMREGFVYKNASELVGLIDKMKNMDEARKEYQEFWGWPDLMEIKGIADGISRQIR